MKVHVQLPPGLSLEDWYNKFEKGQILGLNEESPYGYKRIENYGHEITFSNSSGNSVFSRVIRKISGLNLIGALKNKGKIFQADIVWTHLETDTFAVAFLSLFSKKKIYILGQSVWLIDQWKSYPFYKKYLYKRLVERIDVLTFHSPLNCLRAKEIFSRSRIEIVKFGIPSESKIPVRSSQQRKSTILNLVSVGNDIHRDWLSIINLVENRETLSLSILSTSIDVNLIQNSHNVSIKKFYKNEDYLSFLSSCDVMLVPLKRNLHASGLTAIQEAILLGIPVVVTNVGGLDYYFDDSMVTFYNESSELDSIFEDLLEHYETYLEKAKTAQIELDKRRIGCRFYIEEQLMLSNQVLQQNQ